jgi:membrane-associated phospholipid phosphatase
VRRYPHPDLVTRSATAGLVTAVTLGLTWLALAALVLGRHGAPTTVDSSVLAFMIDHRTAPLTVTLTVITNAGSPFAMTMASLVTGAWLAARRAWSHLALVAAVGTGALVIVPSTKNLIGRIRPPTTDQVVILTNHAFPSGHALGSFAVIGVITAVALARLSSHRARAAVATAATVFVLSVGISRLYLGVHWTTDVLGGWLLGGTWLALCLTAHALLTRQADAAP